MNTVPFEVISMFMPAAVFTPLRLPSTSLKRPDLGERIEILYSTNRGSAVLQDERLARVLTTIDPGGPIRYLSVSMNIHGIGTALAFAAAEGNRDLLQQVLTAISGLLWEELGAQLTT